MRHSTSARRIADTRFFIKIAPLQKFSAKGLRAVWVTCGFAEWLPAAVYLRLLDMHCKGIPVESNKLFAKMSRKTCAAVIGMSDQIPPCVFSDFILSEGRMGTGYMPTPPLSFPSPSSRMQMGC